MKTLSCLVSLIVVLSGYNVNSQVLCPNNWHSYMSQQGIPTCLWLSKEKTSWTNAYTWCKIFDGQLVEIGSNMFNAKITQLIQGQKSGKYWLGLTDMESENVYRWVTSNALSSFTAFLPGQSYSGTAKNCVFTDEKGYWGVDSCKAEFWFVCQKQATPIASGRRVV